MPTKTSLLHLGAAFVVIAGFLAQSPNPLRAQALRQEPEQAEEIGAGIMRDVHKIGTADPIGKILQECLGQNGDIVGMNKCLDEAYGSYDRNLNKIYARTLKQNDPDTQKALRDSQRNWTSFRKAERIAQLSYFKAHGGTVMGVVIGWQSVTAIRERISELMYYLGADQG